MHQCLRKNRAQLTERCRAEEMQLSILESSNTELMPQLAKACKAERARHCGGVRPGKARVFTCLLSHSDHVRALSRLARVCCCRRCCCAGAHALPCLAAVRQGLGFPLHPKSCFCSPRLGPCHLAGAGCAQAEVLVRVQGRGPGQSASRCLTAAEEDAYFACIVADASSMSRQAQSLLSHQHLQPDLLQVLTYKVFRGAGLALP